jgi:hypothetical protein
MATHEKSFSTGILWTKIIAVHILEDNVKNEKKHFKPWHGGGNRHELIPTQRYRAENILHEECFDFGRVLIKNVLQKVLARKKPATLN